MTTWLDADLTTDYSVGTPPPKASGSACCGHTPRAAWAPSSSPLDHELHREVVLKQILDQHADDPTSRARFLQEAEITGGLEHPGIVPVYGLGTYADGRPFYAMRFIRGDSLKEAIDHSISGHRQARGVSPRTPRVATELELRKLLRRFIDVCNAIEYAHSRGVLHRDIKPGNIMSAIMARRWSSIGDWPRRLGRVEPGDRASERFCRGLGQRQCRNAARQRPGHTGLHESRASRG